jgi:hypothetical protein
LSGQVSGLFVVFALSNRKRHRPFDALMVGYLVLTAIQKLEVNAGLSALCEALHKAENRPLGWPPDWHS